MIISWSDALYENNAACKKAFDEHPWSSSIVPIITTDISNKKTLSSCCFVVYRGYYFLLTAKHCINENAHQYVNSFTDSSIDISELDLIFVDDDDIDIAFSYIPRPEDYNLDTDAFINIGYSPQKNNQNRHTRFYLALGYPNKHNKLFNRNKNAIDRFCTFIHNSNRETEEAIKSHSVNVQLFNEILHIACDFTLEKQFYKPEGGMIQKLFKPEGMSGGALLYLNDINNCAKGEAAKFSFAGLIIALKQGVTIGKKKKDVLISTRLEVVEKILGDYIDSRYKSRFS